MSNFSEDNITNQDPSITLSPGVRLRKAREACDLSYEEVADHLKLSVEKIKSLEKGEVESIAAPVFVAGYLRSYAKLVNLSDDDIIADFKALAEMDSPSMDPASSPAANDYGRVGRAKSITMSLSDENGKGQMVIWGSIVVLLVVAAYVFLSGNGEVVSKGAVAVDSTNIKNTNIKSTNTKSTNDKNANAETATTDAEVSNMNSAGAESAEKISLLNSQEEPVADSDVPVETKETVPNADLSELVLYFTEESWVEVTDSQDKRLLYQLGKAGMSLTVTGVAPFNVRLGYVSGVSIMYNGEPYDLSRFSGRKSTRFQLGKTGDKINMNQ